MKRYWNESIKKIEPYTPGEQPRERKYIKLNTNENPYPPSSAVLKAINIAASQLQLYPDPTTTELIDAIAETYNVSPDCIFTGNGSDEVLAMCFKAFFSPERPVIFPDVTYSFYPVYAVLFGLNYETVPLREDFTLPVELMCQNKGNVIFPNPNAPTGLDAGIEAVEKIVSYNSDYAVIVDEAYVDFGAKSAVELINKYPNLLVVQTFSKSRSLAGLRVGFAIGNKNLIAALNTVKNSFNSYTLDRLAISAAAASMRDIEYFNRCCKQIIETRDYTVSELEKLGFEVVPSKTNFIFARYAKKDAAVLFSELKERGILVRYFSAQRTKDYLRISIGTREDMETLISIVKELI